MYDPCKTNKQTKECRKTFTVLAWLAFREYDISYIARWINQTFISCVPNDITKT